MTNQGSLSLKNRKFIMAMIATVGSTITMASTATAATLKITVDNLTPTNGLILYGGWFGFHDGSFDTFDIGYPASPELEHLAEEGYTGLEGNVPGFFEALEALGNDITTLPFPLSENIADAFARSPAGLKGGTQSLAFPVETHGRYFPPAPLIYPSDSENGTAVVTINEDDIANNRYFNYILPLLPTNDGFIGNDDPIEIFDDKGNFIGADFIVYGNQVLDAGTEVNVELPSYIDFTFDAIGKGIVENGTIQLHPGLQPAGTGGFLDFKIPQDPESTLPRLPVTGFENANFQTPGYQIARITITQMPKSVPEPFTITGLLCLGGLSMLCRRVCRSV